MIEALPEEFFLFEIKGRGILYGKGPFERSKNPSDNFVSLYSPDFFLKTPEPFLICKDAEWVHGLPFESGFREGTQVSWTEPSFESYKKLFKHYEKPLSDGTLQKAVLAIFEYGKIENLSLPQLARPLFSLPSTLHGYLLKLQDKILVGASPEVLFHADYKTNKIFSEAVAGSVPRTEEERLIEESTLLKEQHCVIQDIASQLSKFGSVKIGDVHIQELPSIAHLRSRIDVNVTSKFDFISLINALHPTGALGVLPRKNWDSPFVLDLAGDADRGKFGAPFGVVIPGDLAHVVVAIRSIYVNDSVAMIGVGSGVHKDRSAEYEWKELNMKRQSIKSLFSV